MHYLEMRDVSVGFSDRDLFNIGQLDIYAGERIGLIGANGSGKSTLLRVMLGELEPLSGVVKRSGNWQSFRQFDEAYSAEMIADSDLGLWGLNDLWLRDPKSMSGGEKTRSRLARILATPGDVVLLDEPTSNLDLEGIEYLSSVLWGLDTFILISHDRALLNEHCTRTIDIREGRIFDFPGPYDAYMEWLESDLQRRENEYEQYLDEKARLEAVAKDYSKRAEKISKKPKGMSYSEAKQRDFTASHRSQGGKAKSMSAAAKHTEKRIGQLEEKAKPMRVQVIKPDFSLTNPPQNKIIAEAGQGAFGDGGLTFGFEGQDLLFESAAFQLKGNKRTALTGPNGCGKSVFCRLLVDGHTDIRVVPKAKFAFFRQEMEMVDPELTILQNIRNASCQQETTDRSVLARMGFYREDVHKKAAMLSGGERVKLSFAMLFVSEANVLVLDEPTNFLDIPSMEAIESLLQDFEGTLLFVSHDRTFVQKLADEVWTIRDRKIELLT